MQKAVKIIKMDKKKSRIVVEVLSNVSIAYTETAQYIENNMLDICSREKVSIEEVFHFVVLLY